MTSWRRLRCSSGPGTTGPNSDTCVSPMARSGSRSGLCGDFGGQASKSSRDTEAERAAEPAGAEGGHELHRVFDREQVAAIEGAARVLAEQLHRGRVGTGDWAG